MANSQADQPTERATKLALIGTFLAVFSAVGLREHARHSDGALRPLDLALLGLAVYRGGRLVSYDGVAEPFRAAFTRTTPDSSGAGEAVNPQGHGPRRVIGELLACPVCSGTWIAAGLVYGLRLLPGPTRLLLAVLAATGVAELLDGLAETLTWTGRAARERAGALSERHED